MKLQYIGTVNMPDIFLCLIANADTSGLTENEIERFDKWEEKIKEYNKVDYLTINMPDDDQRPFFTWVNPIIPLGCNCYELSIYGGLIG